MNSSNSLTVQYTWLFLTEEIAYMLEHMYSLDPLHLTIADIGPAFDRQGTNPTRSMWRCKNMANSKYVKN